MALAHEIAQMHPFALAQAKRAVNQTVDIQGFYSALQSVFDIHQTGHGNAAAGHHPEDLGPAIGVRHPPDRPRQRRRPSPRGSRPCNRCSTSTRPATATQPPAITPRISALQSVFDIHQTGHGNALSVGGYPILTGLSEMKKSQQGGRFSTGDNGLSRSLS